MNWKELSQEEILQTVNDALRKNQSYHGDTILGTPGSSLDDLVFDKTVPFLGKAPFLNTLVSNPNHIGCHTLGNQSTSIYKGTQEIEKQLIKICAEDIFKGEKNMHDGYVSSGGTEANIEALWIYRNYFMAEYGAKLEQIGVLFSEDTHYSILKACNLLNITPLKLEVNFDNREIQMDSLKSRLNQVLSNEIKYFIVILNMGTTMFGSVDEIDPICALLDSQKKVYKIHVDAAFGGFIYPFANPDNALSFKNPSISSISIDAHKMLQTPYGTGIFLIKKGLIKYALTQEASYVPGLDYTLCGSRSGANAIAVWMTLMTYGEKAWRKKINQILDRTNYLCHELKKLGISFYRNPFLNIISIRGNQISPEIAKKYELVSDNYDSIPTWWKIVVMDHVKTALLNKFIVDLKKELVY